MIRKIIIGIVILVVLVIIYNLLIQITTAVKSSERLSTAAETVYNLEIKNKELKKQLIDIGSADFIEQQARDKLGLGRKGETVVIVPQDKIKMILGVSKIEETRFPNALGWWKVFFK